MRNHYMEMEPREERGQGIARERWFSEKLKTQFPPLSEGGVQPTTCDEFIRSFRLAAAFSSLSEAHEAAGLCYDEALAHDLELNSDRFGVEDPKALLQELSRQVDLVPGGPVDTEVLKKGFVLLDALRLFSVELAAHCAARIAPTGSEGGNDGQHSSHLLQASYLADADALEQALGVIEDLLIGLGISPPKRERRTG